MILLPRGNSVLLQNTVAAVAVLLRDFEVKGRARTAYLEKRWLDGRNVPAQWEMLDAQLNWQSIAKITPNCKKIWGLRPQTPAKHEIPAAQLPC